MKKKIFLVIVLPVFFCSFELAAQPGLSSFAIFVDERSYAEASHEIEMYADAVRKQGLFTYVIIDKWNHPDSIRNTIVSLYRQKKSPLEGVVFIGDIPVAMLRDAQHLTTAFKMDQERYPWHRSSVPSDRFYEDFDLSFTYLKHDSLHPLLHYYSLDPSSAQMLTPDIYSARIKPPQGPKKYAILKQYLKKVTDFKNNPQPVDQVLFFTGHGYNSEDPRTWMDEKLALTQQFGYLNGQQNYMNYINFLADEHIKFQLMNELKRTDLDIALLHHHGGATAQYLDGEQQTSSIPEQIENLKYYLRSKARGANNPEESKAYFRKNLEVPDAWFYDDKLQQEKDSIFNANLDINYEELADYRPGVPFLMFDACFNGSYQLDEHLAAGYLFNNGAAITAQANSTNVLQDKWADEMVGLLGLGLRAGFWNQRNCTLETHLLGDPTFAFASVDKKLDINSQLMKNRNNAKYWKKQLQSEYPDMQALALHQLFQLEGSKASDILFNTFTTSLFFPVRMEALTLLARLDDPNFIKAVNLGITDSYDLIQRFSAIYMSETGHPSHIPYLINALAKNNVSKRVAYTLRDALPCFAKAEMLEELDRQQAGSTDSIWVQVRNTIDYATGRTERDIREMLETATAEKDILFTLKSFRNTTVHPYLGEILGLLASTASPRVKLTGIEMLGWFHRSYKKQEIERFCIGELAKKDLPVNIQAELNRTINRMK